MAIKRSLKEWFQKYFLEGQALSTTQEKALINLDPNAPWQDRLIVKHRRVVGILIPFAIVHFIWWTCAIKYNYWALFPDLYYISITMIFGSLIAGMTSEGGASVAFPVLTLAFNIHPTIARDFGLMIQSVGMSAAAFTIFWMRIQVEWRSIIFCSSAAIIGIIIGLEFIDPKLTPPQKKMGFVSVWFAFAFALFLLNRYHKRKTFKIIPDFNAWKLGVLLVTGFIGGIFSAIGGSGLDICSFSVLTLLFRVSEKTATPTSVVLMAGNTMVGFYWRQVMMEQVHIDAYHYLAVCVPIVVLGAPLGSMIGSHFHRQVLASFVYITDTVALISGFAIVPVDATLVGVSVGIVLFGFAFFGILCYLGQRLLKIINEEGKENIESSESEALYQTSSETEQKLTSLKTSPNGQTSV
ncbi:uncharacterized protein LOC124433436 [Xenia sp. Carnegie-2017]|uniref:uncharacterized protein LOC124433436 n=1 Tax=Xenia sp. Carnegie-2017 TaxID=2897299 RepID=UPI001F04E8CF|nr:uncharacterized protein LOC124433436 [Xenia sp. Carnegie-2017]XP_046839161.1 uncharacterized protein LOC124433436 [Xenia sp. Carnegie-2017]